MSSYTSPDEARSDLFLSGAAYLFGATLLALLFGVTGLDRLPGVGVVLAFTVPLLTTVLVPVLLMRHRGDSLADLGVGGDGGSGVGAALIAVIPILVAALVTSALGGLTLASQVPLLRLLFGSVGEVLVAALWWVGLMFLALYCTVKSRDAFRGETVAIDEAVIRVGRFIGIACGGALVILMLANLDNLDGGSVLALLAYPLGVTGAVAVALRLAPGASTTTMPTVLTPAVLLALGPFGITFNARQLVFGLFLGALYAGVGLIVAVLVERTRQGTGVLVLGLALGLGASLVGAASLL